MNGKKQITPPKKRFNEFEITKSVRYGDITVLYDLFTQYALIELLNGVIPRRVLPVCEVFAALAITHIIDRETKLLQSRYGNEDRQ